MSQDKPSVYLDANIISALSYRGSDPDATAMRLATRNWWLRERQFFQVWSSRFMVRELENGEYANKNEAVAEAQRLRFLPFTAPVRRCSEFLLESRVVPANKPEDAIHLAFATAHGIDYLLTWNRAHLVNLDVQEKWRDLYRGKGWHLPRLVTPNTIPKVMLGQEVRRREKEDSERV